MPNIKLVLEYDGSYFCGWQEQSHATSIQSELHRTIETVLREKIKVVQASGRTDAGVHARAQVANFRTESAPDLERLKHSISSLMRPKLAVLSAEFVDDDFSALRNAKRKQYTYEIVNRVSPLILDQGRAWYVPDKLNIELMQQEARKLVGTHDFTSLRSASCENPNPVRTIIESELTQVGDNLTYRVIGPGFLKHMVRTIVGTLVEISKGTLKPASILEIIALKDRTKAGITAPPWGLYLDWVSYE